MLDQSCDGKTSPVLFSGKRHRHDPAAHELASRCIMKGEETPFPCGKKLFPPPRPLLPQKPPIKTACITGSLFLWPAQVEGCSCSGKNSATSAAGRRKDALKRLDGSIKYHRVLSGPGPKIRKYYSAGCRWQHRCLTIFSI